MKVLEVKETEKVNHQEDVKQTGEQSVESAVVENSQELSSRIEDETMSKVQDSSVATESEEEQLPSLATEQKESLKDDSDAVTLVKEESKSEDQEKNRPVENKKKLSPQEREELLTRFENLIEKEESLLKSTTLKLQERQKRLNKIQKAWDGLAEDGSRKIQKLQQRFSQLSSELKNEMDWERWSNSKRKEDLLKKALLLKDEEGSEELATKVKSYQAEWKTIGPSVKQDDRVWKEFKETCDTAYAKVQDFYKLQDESRAEVAVKKESMLEDLRKLSSSTEWSKSFKGIKQIQDDWKELGPANRENHRKLEKEYQKLCNTFFKARRAHFAKQDEERSANLKLKEELCEKAEHWAEKDDWQRTLPEIKKLQTEWKKTGPVPKQDSDGIWKRFSEACDKVYAKKNEVDSEKLEELKANHVKKEDVCLKMEETLNGEDIDAISKELDSLEKEYKSLGPSPKKEQYEINKRFSKIFKTLNEKSAEQAKKRFEAREKNSEIKAEICLELESLLHAEDWSQGKERIPEIRQRFKAIGGSSLEKALKKRFEVASQWLEQGRQKVGVQAEKVMQENLNTKERLCFDIESLAGIESPEVSASLQRQWMIAELNAKMGKGSVNKKQSKGDEAKKIIEEWYGLGPVPAKDHEKITSRFEAAKNKIKDGQGLE